MNAREHRSFARDEVLETQGLFDPFTMGMRFSERYLPDGLEATLANHRDATLADHGHQEAISAFLAGVPSDLLAHETAHLWQAVATNWGIRSIFHIFSSTGMLLDVAHAAHSADGSQLHVGIADSRTLSSDPHVARHLHALVGHMNYVSMLHGGIRIPWHKVQAIADIPASGVVSVTGYRPREAPLYFVRVQGLSEDVGVLLGSAHLFESYGALVQDLRASLNRGGATGSSAGSRPFDPYFVLTYLYRAMLEPPSQSLEPFELMGIVDTVLMGEVGLHGSLIRHTEIDGTELPIDLLMRILPEMYRNPDLRLRGAGPSDLLRFQENLLRCLDLPVQRMQDLAEMSMETFPIVLEGIGSTFPMVYYQRAAWERAARLANEYRRMTGGACPSMALVLSPRIELERAATSSGGLIQIGPLGTTDGSASEVQDQQFMLQMFSTMRQNLLDLSFGPTTCPWESNCILPRRPACAGVTTDLAEAGNRCPREGSIVAIVHALNTNLGTPGALGASARDGGPTTA